MQQTGQMSYELGSTRPIERGLHWIDSPAVDGFGHPDLVGRAIAAGVVQIEDTARRRAA